MPDTIALVVSFDVQHRFLASNLKAQRLFGYSEQLLLRTSLDILSGPRTDSALLTSAINRTAFRETVTIQSDLYDFKGQCEIFTVTCQPMSDAASIPVACQLLLQLSQASNANPKTMLSRCNGDSKVQRVCAEYSSATGLPEDTFIGQPAQTLTVSRSPNAAGLLVLVHLATAAPEQRSGLPLRTAGDCRPRRA